MTEFSLQFPIGEIEPLASRYSFPSDGAAVKAGTSARKRGFYTHAELVRVCEWKTPRSRGRVARNSEAFVEGITQVAFDADDEEERMAGPVRASGG